MNDRELLELAARAFDDQKLFANNTGAPWQYWIGYCEEMQCDVTRIWDPLEDDGDALRLVAQLKMSIDFMDGSVWRRNVDHSLILEYFGGDHDPCYRRCIVRAAAEIGKSMEGK